MGRVFIPTQETFSQTADMVVIGGGIVGVATAFWLSRAGLDRVLVEVRDGLSALTTPSSIECFRAQFTEPVMARLALPSIEVFEHFAEVVGIPDYDISLRCQGYLFVSDDPGMADDLGTKVEKHRSLPGFYLNCDYWAGVVLSSGAGKCVADLVTGTMDPQDNPLRPTRYAEGTVYEGDSFLRGRH